jgi:perosamine synthetase
VLRSGRLAQGPMVERFEQACAAMAGTTHAVAMSNGTVTLEAILCALGVGPGDEVITSPLSFIATANAIRAAGATPVFADIGPDYNVDPAAVEALIGPRTVAIMPVHLYGQPANMPALTAIAARHGLAVVEDAAQAHGAHIGGRPVGSWGHGSFSFYATKNAQCGEGGAVTTNDAEIARQLRMWRNQGMADRYDYQMVGRNARLTEVQAAIGVASLGRLAERNRRRVENARELRDRLKGTGLVLPADTPGHVWHQFTVLAEDRDALVAALHAHDVEARVYYPGALTDAGSCPVADLVASRCLSLPVHDQLSYSELDHIVWSVAGVLGA